MEGAEQILVVILASVLAFLLILAIVAVAIFIQILRQIKRIVAKAEHIADNAEAVTEFFRKGTGPMAVGRLMTTLADAVFQRRSKQSKGKGDDDA